jgi:hypothetical protein
MTGKVGRPKGFKMSENSKKQISETMKGRQHSEETKERIRASVKEYYETHTYTDHRNVAYGNKYVADGYVMVYTPDGYLPEHRIIAESTLGRRLKSNEVVHHVDRDTTNNRHDNLVIMDRLSHMKLHERINKGGVSIG